MKEFDLISSFFTEQVVTRKDVVLGIGDDAALLEIPEKKQLAVTTDTLVAGVHFPLGTPPRAIGHKAIAVNLSDLAAMGAEPAWISLALTLPDVDQHWLAEFSAGVFELCEYYHVQVIGGDTTQGPLSITVTAQGVVPGEKALKRCAAKPGDLIYVTGHLGDGALALDALLNQREVSAGTLANITQRLYYPVPRILAGQTIRDYANAAIDISDGLMADLGHICLRSEVGAVIQAENLPLSDSLKASVDDKTAIEYALFGGDDYELLFTVSPDKKGGLESALAQSGIDVTCIGQIKSNQKVSVTLDGKTFHSDKAGFQHFSK